MNNYNNSQSQFDSQPNQSRVQSKSKIFGNELKPNMVIKPALLGSSRTSIPYQSPSVVQQAAMPQSKMMLDTDEISKYESQQPDGNQIRELVKHMSPGNIESLMTLFRLQQPLALSIPTQRLTMTSQLQKSSLNQQVPSYSSNYYQQLDVEAERVRERVKEESKVGSFILEKYKRINETNDRLRDESEEINQKLVVFHQQHKMKVFKKETKYTFQLLESKTDELKDFYEEVYNLMELFSVAAHEQQKPVSTFQSISPNNQSPQADAKLFSSQRESSDTKGIEMQSHAVRLFSNLQHYAKHIETTLSEQRRVQSVSENNAEFQQLSQSLLQELQTYPAQEAQSFQELNKLYVLNSHYYKLVASEARDYLLKQNDTLAQMRDGMTSIDRLLYVKSKFTDATPQIVQYYELLDRILQDQDVASIDPSSLPHPNNLNQPLLARLSTLHTQFKQCNQSAANQQHFKNIRLKIFKKCQGDIQTLKQSARDTHDIQVDLYSFIKETITSEFSTNKLLIKVQVTIAGMQAKLSVQGMQEMKQQFNLLNEFTSDILSRQRRVSSMKPKSDDVHYVAIMERLQSSLDPISVQLRKCVAVMDSYVSLGDVESIIQYQELSESIQKDELKLVDFIDAYVQKISTKIRDSTDVESFESDKLNLQKRIYPFKDKMEDLHHLYERVGNETIKSQIQVMLGKWSQLEEVAAGMRGLLEAVEFFSKDNIQTIGDDFRDSDNHTTIAQLEEVCLEYQQKVQAISDRARALSWTSYRAHDYETLIHSELEGYQWMQKLLTKLLTFQKGLQTLIVRKTNQNDFHLVPEQKQIIAFHDFVTYLSQLPFSDLMMLSAASHPPTYRWTNYENMINVQLITILQSYYKQTFNRIDTLGGGILLNSGNFDAHKADITANFMRRLNHTTNLESTIEILKGAHITNPSTLTDLLEFCVLSSQIQDLVKKQIEARQPKSSRPHSQQGSMSELTSQLDQQFDQNLKDIENIISTFFLGVQEFVESARQNPEELAIRLSDNDPESHQVDKLAPLICLCIALQDSTQNYELMQVVTYVNFQSAWISQTIQYFSQLVSIYHEDLYAQVDLLNQIISKSPFRVATVKEIFQIQKVPQIITQYLSNCTKEVEELILQNQQQKELQDLKMFLNAIRTYKQFDMTVKIMVSNIQEIESHYIHPLESQQQRALPKLNYLPQTFIELIYDRITSILGTCDTILKFLKNYDKNINLGVIKINLKELQQERGNINRWGHICQTIIKGMDSNQQFEHNYSDLEDKDHVNTQMQSSLLQTWNQLES